MNVVVLDDKLPNLVLMYLSYMEFRHGLYSHTIASSLRSQWIVDDHSKSIANLLERIVQEKGMVQSRR